VEAELVENVLDRALDVTRAPPEALDDGLGRRVQVGTLSSPLLEGEIDVVLVGNSESLIDVKLFDVEVFFATFPREGNDRRTPWI
jgi:hypothetical protein